MSDKYWFNGVFYDGLAKTGIDTGSQKYWFNGLPVDTLTVSTSSAPPATVLYSLMNVG